MRIVEIYNLCEVYFIFNGTWTKFRTGLEINA